MRYLKKKDFNRVQAFELGWSPIGKPFMTVHFYVVDGFCIDTGFRRMQNEAVSSVSQSQIHHILLTHHHEDHSGNAAVLNETLDAPVLGHPVTVEKMKRRFKILPYQHYAWGSAQPVEMQALPPTVQSDHIELHAIHTPGHSKDHTVFLEKKEGWLFSGDLFIAERIKYFRADEKMKAQIDSLKKICQYDFDCLYCAHNPQLHNGKQKLQNKLQYLEDIYGTVKGLHAKGLDLDEIIKKIGLRENYVMKCFCMGNLSMKNMVRSVFAD